MLDFEKCKEVVEDVWGWKTRMINHENVVGSAEDSWWSESIIHSKVNSWGGFGRTVEAMEKYWAGQNALDRFFNSYLVDKYGELYHWTSETLRDDTHLAALEAVRSEK